MLIRSSLLMLLALVLAGCGIGSDYDLRKDLRPVMPLPAGTYVSNPASANEKPMPVALRGDTYFVEFTSDNGVRTIVPVHFYRIPEFDGHIMQMADRTSGYVYFYTRVTNTRIEILNEDIDTAVLPPHLASLFVYEAKDENDTEGKAKRTGRLMSGRDILIVLRALAGAKYPMRTFGVLKRIS